MEPRRLPLFEFDDALGRLRLEDEPFDEAGGGSAFDEKLRKLWSGAGKRGLVLLRLRW